MTVLDKINYLNIGLMVISLIAAIILPFEVFLFSYAFIGPLHYLTEISWLHDRKYFSLSKWDWIPLAVISLAILLGSGYFLKDFLESIHVREFLSAHNADLIFIAFGIALVTILTKKAMYRVVGISLLVLITVGFNLMEANGYDSIYFKIFGLYTPTLIHVYLFTGLFILFGSLKSKSTSGYASFAVFVLCAIACFYIAKDFAGITPGVWAKKGLTDTPFLFLNSSMINDLGVVSPKMVALTQERTMLAYLPGPDGRAIPDSITDFNFWVSSGSIYVMRFIAFAYTYHYLNWFSKTSVIKWHEVPKARFITVIVVWIASIALYLVDYNTGFKWLFFLSFAHVLLEFPLNHQSFIGIGREFGMRLGLVKAPVKSK